MGASMEKRLLGERPGSDLGESSKEEEGLPPLLCLVSLLLVRGEGAWVGSHSMRRRPGPGLLPTAAAPDPDDVFFFSIAAN